VSDGPRLRKHHLTHIDKLTVSAELLQTRYAAGCAMGNCRGNCCLGGASIDTTERDRIVAHAALVRAQMDETQQHDGDKWFEDLIEDADYASGMAVTTQLHNDRCVFLNGAGLCVLQMAEEAGKLSEPLKPFFCRAYPIYIQNGMLTIDHQCDGETKCCAAVAKGPLTVFDVCAFELEYVLGPEGAAELRCLAADAVKTPAA
jgi:Fe-S-cluster containining protein